FPSAKLPPLREALALRLRPLLPSFLARAPSFLVPSPQPSPGALPLSLGRFSYPLPPVLAAMRRQYSCRHRRPQCRWTKFQKPFRNPNLLPRRFGKWNLDFLTLGNDSRNFRWWKRYLRRRGR